MSSKIELYMKDFPSADDSMDASAVNSVDRLHVFLGNIKRDILTATKLGHVSVSLLFRNRDWESPYLGPNIKSMLEEIGYAVTYQDTKETHIEFEVSWNIE